MNSIEHIWQRNAKESVQAYEAFKIYMNLGSKRSLKLVAESTNKSISCISQWSVKWNWVNRVFAYDSYLTSLELEERENHIRIALKRHADTSEEFQKKTIEALKELGISDFKSMSPIQLVKLFELAVNIERKALGIADIDAERRLEIAESKLKLEADKVSNQNGDNLEDSSTFMNALDTIAENIWSDSENANPITND